MREFVLADLLELTKDGEWGEGNPSPDLEPMLVIRGTDFSNARYSNIASVPMRYIPRAIAERKALQPEDILIETAGGTKDQHTGRTVLLKKELFRLSEIRFTCASFSRFLRVKKDLVRPDYLFWFLQNLYHTGKMYPFHVQHTGVARFQYTQFAKSQVVSVPDLSEQNGIATLLNLIDDKIDLNRRMNETLESMARTIFKDWFVDFGPTRAKMQSYAAYIAPDVWALFPDRLDDEGKPEGWKTESVYKIADVIYGAPFASSQFNRDMVGEPLIRIRDLVNESPGVWTPEVHPKGYKVKPGDIVVGMDGEFRAYLWGGAEAWLNQRVCVFVPKDGVSSAFVRNSIIAPLAQVEATEIATTVIHLGKNDIDRFFVVVPDMTVLNAFNALGQPIYDQIVANKLEARTLTATRNLLLPKLMSGEIQLRAAEKALEAVA